MKTKNKLNFFHTDPLAWSERVDKKKEKSLRRMMQFAIVFTDEQILATLWRQLSWSHFKVLIPIKDELQLNFYTQMCRIEGWSVKTLQKRIDSKPASLLITVQMDCLYGFLMP